MKPKTPESFARSPQPLMKYLSGFLAQSEAGLIISETYDGITMLSKFLQNNYLHESSSPEEALKYLTHGQSTYLVLTPPLDTQTYYLLCQYARRPGIIQLLDRKTYKLSVASIEPNEAHLLFLVTRSDLLTIEERYPIRDKIGLIERFSDEVAA